MPPVRVDRLEPDFPSSLELIGSIVHRSRARSQKRSKHAATKEPQQPPAAEEQAEEAPKTKMNYDYDKNGRKELLFAEICGVEPNPFLTNRANIPPGKDGKGGVQYDKKSVWENKILKTLASSDEFKGDPMPMYQAVLNFVDRVVKANTDLFTSGQEQAAPSEDAEGTTQEPKDETFTP